MARYTKKEIAYIEKYAGSFTVEQIARGLGRPVYGLAAKMKSMGCYALGEEIGAFTASSLAEAIGVSHETVRRWTRTKGLKAVQRGRHDGSKKCKKIFILPENFWNWAYQNKEFVPFHKIQRGVILPEPDWLDDMVKEAEARPVVKPWTPAQERRVWSLAYEHGFSNKEIAKELGRTALSIEKKLARMRKERLGK